MSDFIDKAQHKAEEIAGEAKEHIGSATGDDEMRGRGAAEKAKANAHQAADTVSDAASGVADSATKAASSIADSAAATASDAADTAADLVDRASAKAREVDVDAVVDTATSPRTLAVVTAVAGAVLAAVLISRNRRRRSPHLVRESKRAARAIARSTGSKPIFGR